MLYRERFFKFEWFVERKKGRKKKTEEEILIILQQSIQKTNNAERDCGSYKNR
jgi:hypothetical protein